MTNRRPVFTKVDAKPLTRLPANAYRARSISYIESQRKPLSTPDCGAFIAHERPAGWAPVLMTWGCNIRRETVERSTGRKFVFVGLVYEDGIKRENFEEVL